MNKLKKREIWLDNLRIVAIICVVIIHVSRMPDNYQIPNNPNILSFLPQIYQASARICVPLFVMISGAIQLDQTTSTFSFYQKRIPRILLVLFFWGSIYILFNHIFASPYNISGYIGSFVFSSKPGSFHLWFLYLIIELYLITPLLWQILKKLPIDRVILLSLVLIVLFFDFTPLRIIGIDRATLIPLHSSPDYLLFFMGYIPYYLLGKVIKDLNPRFSSIQTVTLIITFIGSLAYSSFFSIQMDNEIFYYYTSINVLISTICLFCLFYKLGEIPIFGKEINAKMGGVSFGVYLIHNLVRNTFQLFDINAFLIPPSLGIPIYASIVFIISAYLTALLSSNKFTKMLV